MAECNLCHSVVDKTVIGADKRTYYSCSTCSLIFVDNRHFLNPSEEKQRYLNHENSIEDQDYLDFLSKAVNPVLPFLDNSMRGLDYGCGPVTAIEYILKKKGICCDSYDPFFHPNVPEPPFDFIFSTEVFEHFYNPYAELKKLYKMLSHEGIIAIMTEFYKEKDHFKNWYYTKDPSHVCFYNLNTFDYICKEFNFQRIYTDNNRVITLKKLKAI